MTKAVLIKRCEPCGIEFRKGWRHQTYCSLVCAIFPRIDKRGPDDCWPWIGAKNDRGYGQISWNKERIYVHRFVCAFTVGGLEDSSLDTLHSCDNPPCCNPRHVSFGTATQNSQDMHRKGRDVQNPVRGIENHNAKLTENQVRAIRRAVRNGETTRALAKKYGMSQPTIAAIRTGRLWAHLL